MKWILRISAVVLALIVVLPIAGLALLSALAKRPDNLGPVDGRLRDCPDTPNCVCSHASSAEHAMPPIPLTATATQALADIKDLIDKKMPRARVVRQEGNYLHAEFSSALFRFVDDVEFLVDEQARVIHFRSASRVGRSDLGANRRRMEEIIERLRPDGGNQESVR